ncbi:MAG: GC-type dockerin domain-anchored protein [Phycisphaerales bacterium JB061]
MTRITGRGIPAIAAGLLFTGLTSAQAVQTVPEGSLNGPSAVRELGDRLGEIAQNHGITAEELASILSTDLSAYVTPAGTIMYVCPPAPPEIQNDTRATGRSIARGGIPLDDFLNLESRPGSSKTIYLDFDGHQSVNNGWGHNINFPAWDRNGNTNVFTDAEKEEIIGHWLEVAEDFVQFDINVTTKDPGVAALVKSNGDDSNFGMRVIMSQYTNGFGEGTGGIALLSTFRSNTDTPCFVFNKGLGAGPMSASHEAGHTLALRHDGLNGSEYHPGSSNGSPSWGPIMGAPFGRTLVQWSRGDYPGATQTIQQDTAIITNNVNEVVFIDDDHPDVLYGGTPISSGDFIQGVIHSHGDIDAFSFTAFGGDVTIDARTVDVGPNFDIRWNLYLDSPLTLIDQFNPEGTYNANKTYTDLPLGNYTVVLEGGFQPVTNGPVSNYGSVGTYSLEFSQSILLLELAFAQPLPSIIAPGVPTPVSVQVTENGDTLISDPVLNYQRAGDTNPTVVTLTGGTGGLYTGILPAFNCGDDPDYWLSAEGQIAGVITNPVNGTYQATIGEGISVADNGETDIGWTVSGNATAGQWVRGVPQDNDRSDPPADYDGSGQCWQTGLIDNEPNSDVDGGETILTSPELDFSTGGTVSYAYWMNDDQNTIGSEDYFRVEVSTNGGSSWTTARSYSPDTSWRTDSIDVGAEFGSAPQFRIRFVAADNDPGDILECAVDDLLFESFGCTPVDTCLADTNNDGILSPADFSAWVAAFNAMDPACDQNADEACTPADFSAWVANFNAGCP